MKMRVLTDSSARVVVPTLTDPLIALWHANYTELQFGNLDAQPFFSHDFLYLGEGLN